MDAKMLKKNPPSEGLAAIAEVVHGGMDFRQKSCPRVLSRTCYSSDGDLLEEDGRAFLNLDLSIMDRELDEAHLVQIEALNDRILKLELTI